MNSGAGDTTQLVPGFPIRTPWDHSSVDSSPRLIAASHVLHRLLVPRHPPCALNNLTNTHTSCSNSSCSTKPRPSPGEPAHARGTKDARVHCAVLNDPPAPRPDRPHQPPATPHTREAASRCEIRNGPGQRTTDSRSAPSGPNSVPTTPRTPPTPDPRTPHAEGCRTAGPAGAGGRTGQRSTLEHHPATPRPPEDRGTVTVLAWSCTGPPHGEPVACS